MRSKKISKNNEGYVSVTRDFQLPNEKGYFNTGEYVVRITIDGDKLSNNVRIMPIGDINFEDERECGILNEVKSKYFKQIDFLTTDNRVFPKESVRVIYDKCKDMFDDVRLIKKYQPVKG